MDSRSAPIVYEFGDFELDASHRILRSRATGRSTELTPRAFDTLLHLVEHAGEIVDKQVLMAAVWPNVVVEEGNLTQTVYMLRRALGERPDEHQYIVTVPKRGYRFVGDVRRASTETMPPTLAPAKARASLSPLRVIALLAVVLSVVATAVSLYLYRGGQLGQGQATGAVALKSIAVLPFVNMSAEPEQEYFSDGISEEILNLLAQTQGLQVIARTSSFAFKGGKATVAEIAGDLNVTHVLEGSVRKTGNRVRITAQLIDAETSTHLWSQTYDRTLDDIFAVQTDIAGAVTDALKIQLFGPAVAPSMPRTAAAYEHYLQGQYFFGRRANGDMARATHAYREATRIEPDFARAWAGLAGATWISLTTGEMPADEGQEQLRIAAAKAVELDPNNAEGHFRLSNYYWWSRQPEAARAHYRRALALAPNSTLMLSTSAMSLAEEGNLDGAIERYARVVALDPLSATQRNNYGHLLYAAGRFAEARTQLLRAAELNPDADRSLLGFMLILDRQYVAAESWFQQTSASKERDQGMAMVHHALGRAQESDAALARLAKQLGPWDHPMDAEVLAYRGEIDAAFSALQRFHLADRKIAVSHSDIPWAVRYSPFFKPLRDDPRWEALGSNRASHNFD